MHSCIWFRKNIWKWCFDSVPNNKILDQSKFKAFADNKTNVTVKVKFVLERVENISSWAFSPFPPLFSIGFFIKFTESLDNVLKA